MLDTEGVIEGIFGEAATGDLDGVMSWWAPDGILEDITLAQAFRGHGEIRPYLEMYFAALPGISFEPIRLVVQRAHRRGRVGPVQRGRRRRWTGRRASAPSSSSGRWTSSTSPAAWSSTNPPGTGTAGCASGWAGAALPRPRRSR